MQRGPTSATPKQSRPGGKRGTLLVVEDDEALRRLIRATFEKESYRVLAAADGLQGLQLLESRFGNVDLVVCDIVMPRMNGWQLRERALAAYPRLRFLIITGFQEEISAEDDLRRTSILEKPFHPAELLRKVGELLRDGGKGASGSSEPGSGGSLASTA